MKRGLWWLVLGVAIPTVLLGVGWLWAGMRERASLEREEQARMERAAHVVRGVVDESLEELRAREDARPFYLYNHYYSPPDVLAVSDPVAVSPLAREPEDPRIVGWFQVEPGGAVRTPHVADENREPSEHAARVLDIAQSNALARVRAFAGDWPSLTTLTPGPPSGPLTVSLDRWGREVAEDIQLAQAGSVEAGYRVQQRGRSAPITNRNTIDWDRMQAQQAIPQNAPSVPAERPRPAAVRAWPDGAPLPPVPPAQQSLADVDYTPMAFFHEGGVVALYRLVSHEGTAVVQGVLLDRAHVVDTWIPEIVQRHAPTGALPSVVPGDFAADCALRAPASDVVHGVELCFPKEPLAAATAAMDRDFGMQASALATLLVVVLLAAFTVHRASSRAEELSRQRSAFVSAVSHELRTPLTTLRMHAEMLQDGLVSEERRDRVYEDLVTESTRLARLVENVLELSRLEEGRRPLSIREGRLGIYVHDLAEGLRRFLEAKGFALRVRVPDKAIRALYDAQAVDQIVANLVDNAAKYAARHEPREIEVEVTEDARFAFVRVADRGPGIPESERERVFERFHRVDRVEDAHTPGTGIGLSLVRDLARAMGGDATVRGREGGGAEVVVTLPRAP